MEKLLSKTKLYIVSRDGKSINDFCKLNNITKDNIVTVKHARDLCNAEGQSYVILESKKPNEYQWKLRPMLIKLGMKNLTKFYNKRLINF